MRTILIAAMLSFALTAPTALAKNYANVPPERLYKNEDQRYGHLSYFGFYASALSHWNFTEFLSPVTNITWVEVTKIDDVITRVQEAAGHNIEVVLSVQPFVFNTSINLKAGYYQSLQELERRLAQENLVQHVAMIYPIDEPYLRAANSETSFRKKIYAELGTVNRQLSELFPDIPLGVIFNNKEVIRSDFRIPEGYGWIGFDCYENMYDCKGQPFTHYYSVLLSNMTPEQLLMAVPQSWVKYSDYEQQDLEPDFIYEERLEFMAEGLEQRLHHHYEIALSEPRFVAFIPFIWSFEPAPGKPEKPGFGADRFESMFEDGGEEFIERLLDIGEQIKHSEYNYPNLKRSQTEKSLLRPPNRYRGNIFDISRQGLVSAWAWNTTLIHKSLRMQVVVYQDEQEIYRSGIRRSFILDSSLSLGQSPGLPVMGIHGYRHWLPRNIADEVLNNDATVTIRVFDDQNGPNQYHEITR